MRSIPDVCEVELVRGARASDAVDLLLEVPHGATRAQDYDCVLAALRGEFPAELREFFFVNTDVGAPELAQRVAELYVERDPRRTAAVVRCLVPRTFIDCNRVIDVDAPQRRSEAGEVTPGLHAWVREREDAALLLLRYGAYRALVEAAAARVCRAGGRMLMVHSYAPRSIDVPVDERIVERLREAYAPERITTWPLRASVDLIVDDPEGRRLADPALVERARASFEGAGYDVVLNGSYSLHPVTLAARIAAQHPGQTLCLELRRDLLVPEFTPFVELRADAHQVERAARALADALSPAARPTEA
ncbi:MAG: N-formylglutamate amidohydrolase [Planctomycetota bacterium]